MAGTRLWMTSILVVLVLSITGCGRYALPMAPERYAPRKIRELEVTPAEQGVSFRWKAPEKNARGKELESMDGYRVYRREIITQADIVDPSKEFELMSTVPDTHIIARDELRKSVRAQGKPARRVDVDGAKKIFEYTDNSLSKGKTYLFQIVAVNQGDIEGRGADDIFIEFEGLASRVTKVASLESEGEADDAEG